MKTPKFNDLQIGTELRYNPCPPVDFKIKITHQINDVFVAEPIDPNTRCHAVIIDETNLECFETL